MQEPACEDPALSQAWQRRNEFWQAAPRDFDVAIIGGGVQGACLYHQLVRSGRRVLLLDRGDFGGGTSQASAMLIWGGLLYLKHFDIAEVIRLCAARDWLIQRHGKQVEAQQVIFLCGEKPHRRPWLVHAGLRLYWMLAMGRRSQPLRSMSFPERAFLRDTSAMNCLSFEEGHLRLSDAQFVFDWIERAQQAPGQGLAMNYCEAAGGSFDRGTRRWNLELLDTLQGKPQTVRARWVVNAAGVWADRINSLFQLQSPWQHLMAKGASITFKRPANHGQVLVFDDAGEREGMCLVPWGPVSLWGSTEKMVASPDAGWQADAADVNFLLDSLNQHVVEPLGREDIVALRCGVRPLVVRRGQNNHNPMAISKRGCVWRDKHRPWISIYGGKLTGCHGIARRVSALLHLDTPSQATQASEWESGGRVPPMEEFAELSVPAAAWCLEHRMCWTLEDYLRRRTNIAQWVPRGGLGAADEHRSQLLEIARVFATPEKSAADTVIAYERRIHREHDALLGIQTSGCEST